MFDRSSIKVILGGALAMLLSLTLPSLSSATFTSSTTTTLAVTSGTWDATAPKVELLYSPGLQVSGTQVVKARASDPDGSGVRSVTIQVRRVGTTPWLDVCTRDNPQPARIERDYTCPWKTDEHSNDSYELRAVATDDHGLRATSRIVTTNVANGPLTLDHPGSIVGHSHRMTGALARWLPTLTIRVEYLPVEARDDEGAWRHACSSHLTRTLSCWWDTKDLSGYYDVRVTTTTLLTTPPRDHVIRDVAVNLPSGRQSLGASTEPTSPAAIEPDSDVEKELDPASDTQPADEAPDQEPPADPAEGDDETTPQERDETQPVHDEGEEAIPGDDADDTLPSDDADDSVPGDDQTVEEPELAGVSIDVTDGGDGVGTLGEGDTFTFTYSGETDLGIILPGWAGEGTSVSVRVRDGALLGGTAQDDILDVRSGELPVELGHVHLGVDVIGTDQQILLPATMVAGSVTVDGGVRTTVTVTLDAFVDEDEVLLPVTPTPVLTWTPSRAVTSLTGRACVVEPVGQSAGGGF